MKNTQVLEAYSRLRSLRQNAPSGYISGAFLREFHDILDLLEENSGVKLQNFRVPASEVKPVVTGAFGTKTFYSKEPLCDHNYFVMKVDAALALFQQMIESGGKPTIGFRPPEE